MDGSEGIVRYIGGIMGKKGVFYGIDLTKGDAKNKGSFEGIEYFQTKKGTVTGRFVTANKIKTWSKTKYAKYPFKLNETVFCKKTNCNGVIKYVGVPPWTKNNALVYYGLELAEKKGNSNGMMKKTAYFRTKKQFGIYVPFTEIVAIKNNKKAKKKKKCTKAKKKKKKKHKYVPSNDIDIDVDYEWNVKPNVAVTENEWDDIFDSDIDVEYDWNNNCTEEVSDDGAFDLDFLAIPHYGDMSEQERLSGIFRINISTNEFILKVPDGNDSPLSILSEHDYIDGNENKNEEELMDIDVGMKQIDDALGKYYESFGRFDYYNNESGNVKSIFMRYCENNDIIYEDIDEYFKSEIEDYGYLQFDKDFPLNLSNDIDMHDSIDMYTKQQMRTGEMYMIIKYCYETKKSPY